MYSDENDDLQEEEVVDVYDMLEENNWFLIAQVLGQLVLLMDLLNYASLVRG